jgi:hypothetical protein
MYNYHLFICLVLNKVMYVCMCMHVYVCLCACIVNWYPIIKGCWLLHYLYSKPFVCSEPKLNIMSLNIFCASTGRVSLGYNSSNAHGWQQVQLYVLIDSVCRTPGWFVIKTAVGRRMSSIWLRGWRKLGDWVDTHEIFYTKWWSAFYGEKRNHEG